MNRFFKRRSRIVVSITVLLLLLPAMAGAVASLTYTPSGRTILSPVTLRVITTGIFSDVIDGIGCEDNFQYWGFRLVKDGAEEIHGISHGQFEGNILEQFILELGSYAVDVGCRVEDALVYNGGSNNPALTSGFVVAPYGYDRSPEGVSPGANITFTIAFRTFADSQCDPSSLYWGFEIYDASGLNQMALSSFIPSSTLMQSFSLALPPGDYGSVELTCSPDMIHYGNGVLLEYEDGNTIWSIPAPSPNTDPDPVAVKIGYDVNSAPQINIVTPKSESAHSEKVVVVYDTSYTAQLVDAGLSIKALALYAVNEEAEGTEVEAGIVTSNLGSDMPGFFPSVQSLVTRELLTKGTYNWNTKDIPEGDHYRALLLVTDSRDFAFKKVSGQFSIDHTPPTFVVSTDPAVSRGENVRIIVDASEKIAATTLPEVFVTQEGTRAFPVTMEGSGTHFEGVYHVIVGWDGAAEIAITGSDSAGNKGSQILAGGQFYVGVEPPPKPVLLLPLDYDVVTKGTVTVEGTARANTEVWLTVNGTTTLKTTPTPDGKFRFVDVQLDSEFQKGTNVLSVAVHDRARNISESVVRRVKYNRGPELSILAPMGTDVLRRVATLRLSAKDENKDALRFTYEVTNDNGENWLLLARGVFGRELKWKTTEYPDGTYRLRAMVDDGYARAYATSSEFTVRNFIPVITFDGGVRTVTNKKSILISGTVMNPKDESVALSSITSLEYRVDHEEEWHILSAKDGKLDSAKEEFSFTLEELAERPYVIEVRAKDARGYSGHARKTVVVDFGPPPAPVVKSPLPLAVYGDMLDEEKKVAGVQLSATITAEPWSMVSVSIEGGGVVSKETATSGIVNVEGITLRTHGANALSVFAVDPAGNKSPETKITVHYNNPPTLKFLAPRKGRGINHIAMVRFLLGDPDGDKVSGATLSYRKGGSGAFAVLAQNTSAQTYEWDVSEFAEASDYELKLEATDGTTKSELIQSFVVDNTPPSITIVPLPITAMKKSFTLAMEGDATDSFSGIEFIEYSIDGKEWYKAIISKGFLAKNTHFTMKHPFQLVDGEYRLAFRTVDVAGNTSSSVIQKLVVDTTAPRVGSYSLRVGMMPLGPISNTALGGLPHFQTMTSEHLSFALSLERDTASAILHVSSLADGRIPEAIRGTSTASRDLFLVRNAQTYLWEAPLKFAEAGDVALAVSAIDALGNATKHIEIGSMRIVPRGVIRDQAGTPLSGARVSMSVFDDEQQKFVPWDGNTYGLPSEVTSDASGAYSVFLPAGTYRLMVQKSGYGRVRSADFTIDIPQFLAPDFSLTLRSGIRGKIENVLEPLLSY